MPSPPKLTLTLENLTHYFQASPLFHQIHFASSTTCNQALPHRTGYLNPLSRQAVHIISIDEMHHIERLSTNHLQNLIDELIANGAKYLIFQKISTIPPIFFTQKVFHLIQTSTEDTHLPQTINRELNQQFSKRTALHGSFVVLFGQGILITGDSGTGKSNLLLALVNQGHLWISDDTSEFYQNTQQQIIGHSADKLNGYIHVKGLGPINMDHSFGQAVRLKEHPIDGIVHLSNTIKEDIKKVSAYTQHDTFNLIGTSLPRWYFSASQPNLSLLMENCAKNINLSKWNNNPVDGLDNALTKTLQTNQTKKIFQ